MRPEAVCGAEILPVSSLAEAMGRMDIKQVGTLVDAAWALNQQFDPQSTTP